MRRARPVLAALLLLLAACGDDVQGASAPVTEATSEAPPADPTTPEQLAAAATPDRFPALLDLWARALT